MKIWQGLKFLGAAASALPFLAASQALAAYPQPWEMMLQPAASSTGQRVGDFHNMLLIVITLITLLVLVLLLYVIFRFNAKRNPEPSRTTHNTLVEVLWTVVPVIILVGIAIPSFKLLYYLDRVEEADMTIKVIGRQWYWTYEYPDHGNFAFDSNMIPEDQIQPGQLRLLEVDNRIVLPVDTNVRILVTASDVLHSFAVPAFGIKKDAVPGRINETWVRVDREGVYYGQCSELCGVNHAYMPIAVEVVSKERFAEWVEKAQAEFAQVEAPQQPRIAAALPR